jgi:hypothetical protein
MKALALALFLGIWANAAEPFTSEQQELVVTNLTNHILKEPQKSLNLSVGHPLTWTVNQKLNMEFVATKLQSKEFTCFFMPPNSDGVHNVLLIEADSHFHLFATGKPNVQ